jgi:hypothetical protein
MSIQKSKSIGSFVITVVCLEKHRDISLFLGLKDGSHFDLCPRKVGILNLLSEDKPRPALHESLDEVGVVAWTHEVLEFAVVLFYFLHHELIGVSYLPHEIAIVVEGERRLKLASMSPNQQCFYSFLFGGF